ncbi:hypothetical protein BU23DRAFT_602320 [Bimuria novae-zelandiae CBS 107.79]|uniref:F-box domain-containing protein n=1 Tax=Bimuria novae-zelandiae CBS 107.79 TaxID=1447943 RepID=A0A6A5UTG1_9PLEO|nr:hypothetical protein BU23DRAFT_602320 [Bimuria novae-zelandiae CBS 107.79]
MRASSLTCSGNPAADGTAKWGWDTLPTEIQLQILGDRLAMVNPITYKTHPIHSKRRLLPLLLTNKQMHDLAAEVYYRENTIRLVTYSPPINTGRNLNVFLQPNIAHRHHVRKLELELRFPNHFTMGDPQPMFMPQHLMPSVEYHRSDVLLLMEPLHPPPQFASTAWQAHFTAVRHFKVVFSGAYCFGFGCNILAQHRPNLRLPEFARIPMRPTSIEVVVPMETGKAGCEFNIRKGCGFECAGIWEQWGTMGADMVELRTPE